MRRLWESPIRLAILLLAVSPGLVARQTPAAPPAPRGTTILLPPRLMPGEQATLAVLDSAGRVVPDVLVEFPGAEVVRTDSTGRAVFVAPLTPGILTAHFPGRPVNASATVVPAGPLPAEGMRITEYPRVVSVTDRFSIEGFGFAGRADGNHVTLGDNPAAVLAASPLTLVIMPPQNAGVGAAQMKVEAGGRSPARVAVTIVSLQLSGPTYQLAQGQKAALAVRVRGTEQRLAIEARNLSPKVVDLPRGNVQRVTSSGGPGNHAEIEMTGLAAGDFSVSVRLVPGASGLPDMEAVRLQLLAARKVAAGEWGDRLDRLIRRIERDPQDVSHVRDALEKMLAEKPEAGLAKQVEAAWKILLQR